LPDKSLTGEQFESLDMWTWCKDYVSGGNKFYDESKAISDLNNGLDSIAGVIRQHGPLDEAIGFSSGACVTALIVPFLSDIMITQWS
jgi:hypothetical protein